MSHEAVTVVRVYLTEAEQRLEGLLRYLHDEMPVRGVTVFRAISGFGDKGHMHSASLVDLALDLPLVVEFFDRPQRVREVIAGLRQQVEPQHILSWSAQIETGE